MMMAIYQPQARRFTYSPFYLPDARAYLNALLRDASLDDTHHHARDSALPRLFLYADIPRGRMRR